MDSAVGTTEIDLLNDDCSTILFILTHEYEFYLDDGRGPFDEVKILGVFRNKEIARALIPGLMTQPGFRDFPDGFWLRPIEVDCVGWEEGFASG